MLLLCDMGGSYFIHQLTVCTAQLIMPYPAQKAAYHQSDIIILEVLQLSYCLKFAHKLPLSPNSSQFHQRLFHCQLPTLRMVLHPILFYMAMGSGKEDHSMHLLMFMCLIYLPHLIIPVHHPHVIKNMKTSRKDHAVNIPKKLLIHTCGYVASGGSSHLLLHTFGFPSDQQINGVINIQL